MEPLKEYLLAKYFSSFGYVVAALQVPALVLFAAVTGQLRTSERRTFRCDVPDCRDDCLRNYDEQFNSPLPLYAFVLLCFAPSVAVCIAYSWCCVKSRVDEIEAVMKPDVENPRPRPREKKCRVFYCYFVQLLVRLVVGISFAVLQNSVFYASDAFYASDFPTEFDCLVCDSTALLKPTANSNATNIHPSINCDNSVGSDNATWAKGIWMVNILFTLLVFGEMCYLSMQALKSNTFTFDFEFCPKYLFKKGRTQAVLRDIIFRLRRRIQEDTEYLEPLIASGGESNDNRLRALDDIFVDVVIHTGRAKHQFDYPLKRHELYEIYLKPEQGSVAIENLEQLFLPNNDTNDPRRILIVGRPGIGKSLLCNKLLRDLSKNGLFHSKKTFKFGFLFQFRWFNSGTEDEKKISLKQLLSRVCPDQQIDDDMFQYILDNPERVLLVFDGLDEFKHHDSCLEDERAQSGDGATEEMHFSALYVKLVKGKQLRGATVVTTCRPNVVQSVASLEFDRKVEIMGFTPEKVKKYVGRFCAQDTQTINRIWMHLENNLELLSLCYIPVNSFIICSLLKEWIELDEQGSESTLPKTTTKVYTGALRLFIFKHHPEFKGKPLTKGCLMKDAGFSDSIEKMLSHLGSLAKTGIEASQLIFGSPEVRGMENCGLLNPLPAYKDKSSDPYTFRHDFCFIHLTLQELLAAREIAKMTPSDLSEFISSNASDPKWQLVIQFVAGLLRGQKSEAVNSFVSHLNDALTAGNENNQMVLLMLKCLYEYNDETTVKRAVSELHKNSKFNNKIVLSACQVTPVECTAILYFVKHLVEPTALNLMFNRIADQGVSQLCDALQDINNCKLTDLNLYANSITDQGVSHLCDALQHTNCKLTDLTLCNNSITDQGVSHLCDALQDKNCKLTGLNLCNNSITDQGVSHLCDALQHINCKLTDLTLCDNSITDQGVSHLCNALQGINCNLTDLNLCANSITDQGVSHLRDALKHINCKLTKLNLSFTDITDQSVSHLCDALRHINCKLTKLNLCFNNLTDQSVSHLCDALQDINCKLTKLNLSFNSITDQSASHLCDALQDINCKLTDLNLYCNMIHQGVSHLCDALQHINCNLTELNIGGSDITDQRVSHLCDALKHINCKLTKLDLSFNGITDQCVSHLCDALQHINCKLTKLNLSHNSITDQGVSHLCDALKHINCKLTKLNLSFNSITDQSVSLLCDALQDINCKLTGLNLCDNSITDQGVSHLCDALQHINVKLTLLSLADRDLGNTFGNCVTHDYSKRSITE